MLEGTEVLCYMCLLMPVDAQNRSFMDAYDLPILRRIGHIHFVTSTVSIRTNGTCGETNASLFGTPQTRPGPARFRAPKQQFLISLVSFVSSYFRPFMIKKEPGIHPVASLNRV